MSSWRPVVAYAMVSAANQMLWLTFTPITTGSAHHYGVSSDAIGWLAEIFPLVYVVLALPTGRLIDRGLRRWLAVGAMLTAAGAALRLGGDAYATVLAGQVLVSLAQPLVLNAVTRMSRTYLAPEARATGIAASSAGIFGGMVLALATGAAIGDGHLRTLLGVQAAFAVLASAWLCFELRSAGRDSGSEPEIGSLRAVWADPQVRALTGLVCVGFGAFIALTTWLQTLLEPAGVSDTEAGVLLLVMVVAGVAGSAVLPPLVARRRAEARFVLASVVAGTAAFVLLAAAPGLWTGLVALVVLGLFLLTDLPVILDLAERRAGPAGGTVSALLWLAGNGAGLVAALVVQAVDGHPGLAFALLAALLVAGSPLIRRISSGTDATVQGLSRV